MSALRCAMAQGKKIVSVKTSFESFGFGDCIYCEQDSSLSGAVKVDVTNWRANISVLLSCSVLQGDCDQQLHFIHRAFSTRRESAERRLHEIVIPEICRSESLPPTGVADASKTAPTISFAVFSATAAWEFQSEILPTTYLVVLCARYSSLSRLN